MKYILKLLLLLLLICILILILKYQYIIYESFNNNTWAIVQYDDRQLSDNDKKLMSINHNYAKAHNYDFIYINNGYNHLPPYWAKVAAVRDIMKQGKHKGVCWIDTDAVFINHSKSIDDFCNIDPNKSFYMAKDPPIFNNNDFNAGVWFVRNDSNGNAIIDYWMKCWDSVSKDWTKNEAKWHCSGGWAGPSYEQGSFIDNIYKNETFSKFIKQFTYDFLQSIDPEQPNAFTIHFAGHYKSEIPKFLKSYK